MDSTAVIQALAALAHPLRLAAYRALVTAGPDGLTPGVLISRLGVPAATLSFHLKELVAAGLLQPTRVSRHIVYRTDYDRMQQVLGYLTENCCGGAPCPPTAACASPAPESPCP